MRGRISFGKPEVHFSGKCSKLRREVPPMTAFVARRELLLGLAGAIGTEQGDEFSGLGLETHAVDGAHRAVALDDVVQQQSWRGW